LSTTISGLKTKLLKHHQNENQPVEDYPQGETLSPDYFPPVSAYADVYDLWGDNS
jgi:hypothetical protein